MSHRRMVDQTTKETGVSSEHREIFTAKYTLDGGTIPVTLVPDDSTEPLKLGGTGDIGPVNLQMIIIDKRISDNNMGGFADTYATSPKNTKENNKMSDIMGEIARMISDKMSSDSVQSSDSARSNFGILGTNTLVQGITLQLTIGDPAAES